MPERPKETLSYTECNDINNLTVGRATVFIMMWCVLPWRRVTQWTYSARIRISSLRALRNSVINQDIMKRCG